MTEILIATQNPGKIKEIQALLEGLPFTVILPSEAFDVDETGTTFEENARLKAQSFSEHFGHILALADDSGLQVDALDGRPGVYSKRYGNSDEHRNQKLLQELEDVPEEKRTARFISVMVLFGLGIDVAFVGTVEGHIAKETRGKQGFGYDPVFIPKGYQQTFAELGSDVKNKYSHRANAMSKVRDFLAKYEESNSKKS